MPVKFASDMFGLFAYLFVMGGLLPSNPLADQRPDVKLDPAVEPVIEPAAARNN